MATQRNNYSAEFKAKVALEALKEQQTLSELGSCYGVHPTLVPSGSGSSGRPCPRSLPTGGRSRTGRRRNSRRSSTSRSAN